MRTNGSMWQANCKCGRGELHGPYFYYFERSKGRQRKRYIRRNDVPRMRAACVNRRKAENGKRSARIADRYRWTSLNAELKTSENEIRGLKEACMNQDGTTEDRNLQDSKARPDVSPR